MFDRTVKDAFPHALTGHGLFVSFGTPVWSESFNSAHLDLTFITKYGERIQGAILRHFDEGEGISDTDVSTLATLIYSHFAAQWEHLYNDMTATYDPIENYNSTETVTESREIGTSKTQTQETDTSNTEIVDRDTTSSSDNEIYGFNSSTASPSDSNTGGGTEDTTTTDTGESDSSFTEIGTHDEDNSITRTRSGNIGVTTSAQMIEGDINVWKWNYIEGVMNDIANFISLKIY